MACNVVVVMHFIGSIPACTNPKSATIVLSESRPLHNSTCDPVWDCGVRRVVVTFCHQEFIERVSVSLLPLRLLEPARKARWIPLQETR